METAGTDPLGTVPPYIGRFMVVDRRELGRIAGRYKKHLIIGGVALVLTFVAGMTLIAFIVYKSFDYTADKVATWSGEAGEKVEQLNLPTDVAVPNIPDIPAPPAGFVEGFMLTVASHWLEQGLASQEAGQIKQGLACIDAVGGPSPQKVVDYLQSRASEEHVVRKLAVLSQALNKEIGVPGPAACANWVLNG